MGSGDGGGGGENVPVAIKKNRAGKARQREGGGGREGGRHRETEKETETDRQRQHPNDKRTDSARDTEREYPPLPNPRYTRVHIYTICKYRMREREYLIGKEETGDGGKCVCVGGGGGRLKRCWRRVKKSCTERTNRHDLSP